MLTFSIYLLTAIMVIDCLFLVLLVLVQLPKKEAGMGQAFGGGATDALFGAGSGNVLTKVTKWAAGIFFALAILLTILGNVQNTSGGGSKLQKALSENKTTSALPVTPTNAAAAPAGTPIQLNLPATTTAAETNK
jgi:preprotein translocase subunit SecG